jgi:DNA polymerase-3 subunit beta
MKVICDRKALEEVLQKAKEATEKRAALPILSNFKLSAEDETLTVWATDLESYLKIRLGANVMEDGEVCISSKKLFDIVKTGECAEIVISGDANSVKIECGRSKFKLAAVDPDEFPEFPEPEDGLKELEIPAKLLLEGIDRTDYAIPKDAENLVLNGMFVAGRGECLHFVGTDGHRLALFKPELEVPGDFQILLPKKALKVLKKAVVSVEDLKVSASENFAFIQAQEWELAVRLLEGEYPDYEAVIPDEMVHTALVDRKEFINALKRVTLLIEGKVKPVKITLADNLVRLEVEDPEFGTAEDELEAEYIGDGITAEFNARYLIEALEHYKSDRVRLGLNGEDAPAKIEADDPQGEPYICLIMPMAI